MLIDNQTIVSGLNIPDMSFLGFFPFAISEDPRELYNASGYSGPIAFSYINNQPPTKSQYPGFSGILGPGTFYPTSGSLDLLTRLYWGVKTWNVTVKFGYTSSECYVGFNPGGGSPESATKTLITQDYCSYNADPNNYYITNPNYCPVSSGDNFNIENTYSVCTSVNPVEYFPDLFCRRNYNMWLPDSGDFKNFIHGGEGYGIITNSCYNLKYTQNNINPEIGPQSVFSFFSLSLMNSDIIGYEQFCSPSTQGYFPEIDTTVPCFEQFGISGERIIDKYGQVTGYGANWKENYISPPNAFKLPDTGYFSNFGQQWNIDQGNPNTSYYCPFIYFSFIAKTTSNLGCTINSSYSTVINTPGQTQVGNLIIMDMPFDGKPSQTGLVVPIYGQTLSGINPGGASVNVILNPFKYWLDNSGNINY